HRKAQFDNGIFRARRLLKIDEQADISVLDTERCFAHEAGFAHASLRQQLRMRTLIEPFDEEFDIRIPPPESIAGGDAAAGLY
ncbi:MAG: hypothetical protein IH897_09815, partial [Planctomycetes bacterium]|nr:hypothetical protein [Planctomycetota bacterium]